MIFIEGFRNHLLHYLFCMHITGAFSARMLTCYISIFCLFCRSMLSLPPPLLPSPFLHQSLSVVNWIPAHFKWVANASLWISCTSTKKKAIKHAPNRKHSTIKNLLWGGFLMLASDRREYVYVYTASFRYSLSSSSLEAHTILCLFKEYIYATFCWQQILQHIHDSFGCFCHYSILWGWFCNEKKQQLSVKY